MSGSGFSTSTKTEATAARLLQAASELMGSNKALAERLRMSQSMLIKYMAGMADVPPDVVLRTVDILLEQRESRAGTSDVSDLPA
jgi:hypothetical protein